jgi:cytidylate kinase
LAAQVGMQIRIVTLEREYGSGGANIAKTLAARLGWKVWDEELTAEIARVAKVYARGSYERTLPLEGESQMFDADRMVAVLHKVVEDVASRGKSVIVGRGAPYILRNRPDAFHVFIYAPVEEKIRRIMSLGKSEKEAAQLVEEVDSERAAFIRHYFGKDWPLRSLYNLMINSKFGDEHTVETIAQEIALLDARAVPQAASR